MKKRIIASLMAVAMLASTAIITANATADFISIGDVTQDDNVNMDDVVTLQKHIAKITEPSKRGLVAADVNFDEKVNMEDVTLIQKKIANLIDEFYMDCIYDVNPGAKAIMPNILSGKAVVGESVMFWIGKIRGYGLCKTELYINDVKLPDNDHYMYYEHKFDKAGKYKITAKIYNGFGEYTYLSIKYKVVESLDSEKPTVKSLDFSEIVRYCNNSSDGDYILIDNSEEDIILTANASMGTAPYEYMFLLDGEKLTDDYSTTNSVSICRKESENKDDILTIKIRDKNGIESSEDFKLIYTFVDGEW
ncbi:MAG: dockerin type I repeat-containing protein [Clostridia bacterium]|nr:dockerin type I repeat-containing protein [Clostridia bacterium]